MNPHLPARNRTRRNRSAHLPAPRGRPGTFAGRFLLCGLAGISHDLSAASTAVAGRYRAWSERGRLTWRTRMALTGGLFVVALVALGSAAWAADDQDTTGGVLASFDTKGTSGISIGQYRLDLDNGGITDPTKAVLATLVSLVWDLYRQAVAVAVWMYAQATGFGWLNAIRPPAEAVSRAIQTVLQQIGIVPFALTAAAFVCGIWMLRGRWAGGMAELIVSCLLAVAATGFLSSPVDPIAGPDGLLGQSQQFGLEFSAAIASQGSATSADPRQLRDQTSGALVDAFLRGPHQLLNYGAVIDVDNPGCADTYTQVMKKGPYDDSTARDRMGECDKAYGDYAANPSTAQLSGMLVLLPGALLLLVLLAGLVLILFIASAVVVMEAAKLTIGLIKGIIPGAVRAGLYQGLASLAVSLGIVIGALAFVATYVLVIREALQPEPGQARDPAATFLVVDLLLVTGIVVMFRWRGQAKQAASRMADRLSQLSPGGASRSAPSGGFPMRTALGVAGGLIGTRLTSYAMGASARRGVQDAFAGDGSSNGGGGGGGGGGSVARAAATATAPAAGRLQQRLEAKLGPRNARYARIWAKVGTTALASTIGAPVYGPRLLKAAPAWSQAKTSALRGTLRSAARNPQVHAAGAFAREYAHNVATGARFASRYTGTTYVAGHAARAAARGATAPTAAAVFAAGPSTGPTTPTRTSVHAPSHRAPAPIPGAAPRPSAGTGRGPTAGTTPTTVPSPPPSVHQPAKRSAPAPVQFQAPGQPPKSPPSAPKGKK